MSPSTPGPNERAPAAATSDSPVLVNSCTQWGKMEEVIVARLPPDACYPPAGPDFQAECNNEYIASTMLWPRGPKHPNSIAKANAEYDNLASILAGEGIVVKRPTMVPQNQRIETPYWTVPTMYNCCPRDKLLVVGREILEATMSQRARVFEEYCYRDIILDYYRRDKGMLWTAAPKPMMRDSLYRHEVDKKNGVKPAFWDLTREQRWERRHLYEFITTEDEPVFDAADVTRCGKDLFVHHSNTTNRAGFDWIKRHFAARGVRAHLLHFPTDLHPSHIDGTFVPLRPGLVLTNPERPPVEEEVHMFREGKWKFVDAPKPAAVNYPMPDWCDSSAGGMAANVLNLSPEKLVAEENEVELIRMLEDLGFDVIPVPFRNTYQFGGAIHCATNDMRRRDELKDFFNVEYN